MQVRKKNRFRLKSSQSNSVRRFGGRWYVVARIFDMLSQALPGLQHLAAVGAGHAPRVNVVGLDMKLDIFLHLGGLAALTAHPALHRVPVHQPAYSLVQILTKKHDSQ